MDGTLIQGWAGHKSFVAKGDGQDGDGGSKAEDFRGQRHSNETQESRTDGDARLYRKGVTASELRYMGHSLSDNRHGLIADAKVITADGHGERGAAKAMIKDARQALADDEREITLGADKDYDAKEFIDACVAMRVTPPVAQNASSRQSAVPDEIVLTDGYSISQRKRELIEQGFGLAKTVGCHASGDCAGYRACGLDGCADDGCLQPCAHA